MTPSSRPYLRGLCLGLGLGLLALVFLYWAGYLQKRQAAPSTAPVEKPAICWVSPTNPDFIRYQPGKDDKGQDLIPVYAKEGPIPPSAPAAKKERKVKYWVDPMDPRNISDKPGKAPCGMDMVPVYEEEGGEAAAPGTIAVDPNTLQSMGVRTGKVEVRELTRSIRAVGKVVYDERRLSQINTKVAGWVERLYVKATGDPIRKGQPLLNLYSPELVSAQREYLLALKNLKSLGKSPYAELGESAQRLLAASRQRLQYWDIGPAQIDALEKTGEVKKDLTLTSPVNGIVIKRLVTQGQYVMPGMPLMEVADLSTVWVEAEIYEYELPWVKVGEHAEMTLTYLPDETFHGKVQYIYPYLSGATRTAKVRLAFPNPKLRLKPDMFAQVTIKSPLPQAAVAVPSEAILDSGERQLVFVALGQGRFEPRPVKLGVEGDGGWRQVTEGLQGGEEVVTSAQFLLDSESRIREAAAKMLQAPKPTPGKEAAPVPGKEPAPAKPVAPPVHKH
ncbi:MAG: efflux RND transporter periplasmic adaptor subunit [Thermodesulfobacteriota bacterium]